MKAALLAVGLGGLVPLRAVVLAAASDPGMLLLLAGFAATAVLAVVFDAPAHRLGEVLFRRTGDAAEDEALLQALLHEDGIGGDPGATPGALVAPRAPELREAAHRLARLQVRLRTSTDGSATRRTSAQREVERAIEQVGVAYYEERYGSRAGAVR